MKKSRAIIALLITVLVIGGLGYVSMFGVGKDKAFAASGIKQGLDLACGVSITYQVVGEERPSRYERYDLQIAEACRRL